jgi:integrase/recombinase XerD
MKPPAAGIVPVEYAVAVDRFLAEAGLGPDSRRVYRICLASWAWPLVGERPPLGRGRRQARPPIVPLAILDRPGTDLLLADAVSYRMRNAAARTVNRELSTLRSAVGWWRRRQWITADPTLALRQVEIPPAPATPLTRSQREALFRAPAGLREQAFWHLLADSGASAEAVLALDADATDIRCGRARPCGGRAAIEWGAATGELISWLLAGRRAGPMFRTDRRAPAGTRPADVCPLTGRGRLSYRRAAEIFTQRTRPLDPAGRGWTLYQLRPPWAGSQIPEPAAISNAV